MNVLVTGGAGYIGSHTVLRLLEDGHSVWVVDNFFNSTPESLRRVQVLTGKSIEIREADIRDPKLLQEIFAEAELDAVIHFAGLKSVGDSHQNPLDYYSINVTGSINLLEAMEAFGVRSLVFSSSATVYGKGDGSGYFTEDSPLTAINPYGRTKLYVERLLDDLCDSDPSWSIAKLRYFNPVGAHESGQIGEDPLGPPNNLAPYIAQVAAGRLGELNIFGNEYPTADGTGVRDYVHVLDLAEGHLAALDFLTNQTGSYAWNLGTGIGSSVLDVVKTFEDVTKTAIPHRFVAPRTGDVARSTARVENANEQLSWVATRPLRRMVEDTWRWQELNPSGYSG